MGTVSSCIKRSRSEWFRQLTGIPPRCQSFYKQVVLRADLKVDPQPAAREIPLQGTKLPPLPHKVEGKPYMD